MRKLLTALMLGTMAVTAAPAFADDDEARRIGERLRDRIARDHSEDRLKEREDRLKDREDRLKHPEDRLKEPDDHVRLRRDHPDDHLQRHPGDRIQRPVDRVVDRDDRIIRDGDRLPDRVERRDPWDRPIDRPVIRDRDEWDRVGYRYEGTPWNRDWTPFGFGYNDSFTRDWVFRNFADRNRNGRISDKEWRRAQKAFYRLADRNSDGRISRGEHHWAMRMLRDEYGDRHR